MSSSIHLYAELLKNIKTLTLFINLRTYHTDTTNAILSYEDNTLTLCHEGETAVIRLPTNIPGRGSIKLSLPATPAKELTSRLSLEQYSSGPLDLPATEDNLSPWPAPLLTRDTRVQCRSCNADLLGIGKIRVWKDLPSENWAEMMDFWHCHKPYPSKADLSSNAADEKGYSAKHRLEAQVAVGLVDDVSFLFSSKDCPNVEVRTFFQSYSICEPVGQEEGVYFRHSSFP